jgi:hypothetical protein
MQSSPGGRGPRGSVSAPSQSSAHSPSDAPVGRTAGIGSSSSGLNKSCVAFVSVTHAIVAIHWQRSHDLDFKQPDPPPPPLAHYLQSTLLPNTNLLKS